MWLCRLVRQSVGRSNTQRGSRLLLALQVSGETGRERPTGWLSVRVPGSRGQNIQEASWCGEHSPGLGEELLWVQRCVG